MGRGSEVLPQRTGGGGGADKVLSMLKGGGWGHNKFWGIF